MFRRGVFDFGDAGTSQFSPFLNVSRFIQMAWEEDLLVIFRSYTFYKLWPELVCTVRNIK
jgi:hypothetical protein